VIAMRKTSFQQVPLKVVRKVVQEQVKRQETESGREIKKKELARLEELLLAGSGKSGKQKKHD
jgi:DNA recombination-dependent growth factor C